MDLEAFALQHLAHLRKQRFFQLIVVRSFSERTRCGGIRRRFAAQIDAYEPAQAGTVVQGFFTRQIGQVNPVPDEVDAQLALQSDERAAVASFRLVRLDHFTQRCPRHDGVHGLQKIRAAYTCGIACSLSRDRLQGQGSVVSLSVTFFPLLLWAHF